MVNSEETLLKYVVKFKNFVKKHQEWIRIQEGTESEVKSKRQWSFHGQFEMDTRTIKTKEL